MVPLLDHHFETIVISNKCPYTVASYLDIVADTLEILTVSNSKLRNHSVVSVCLICLNFSVDKSSRQFAGRCQASLSKRWPSIPTSESFELSLIGPSSSILASTLERCLRLIGKIRYSAAQPTQVEESPILENATDEGIDATSGQPVKSTSVPNTSLRQGPLVADERLRLDGGIVVQRYLTNAGNIDVKTELSAWVRTLRLAVDTQSVSHTMSGGCQRAFSLTSEDRSCRLEWQQ